MESADEVLAHAEVIVVGNGAPEFKEVLARTRPEQTIVDLVRVGDPAGFGARYDGICW